MKEEHYPALYRAADAASSRAQKTFLLIVRLQSVILIAGAALGTLGLHSVASAVLAAITFLTGIFVSLLTTFRRYEDTWYRTRAVAESVKTSAWRFMMRAEPYEGLSDVEAQTAFRALLRRILGEHRDLGIEFSGTVAAAEQVTQAMLDMRALTLNERKAVYLSYRIDEQRAWYARESAWNSARSRWWGGMLIALQATATILVTLRIAKPDFEYWPVEVFAVAAAAVMVWMQVKRFRELSSAYRLAAHEIGVLRGELANVTREPALSKLVGYAESSFSREHTQWVARKDTSI